MPENIVTQAAVFVCELHELAVAALETRGIDGLLPLAESLCTVQLGHAQEMIAIRALGRGVERALDRWQLDEVVGREDELWRLGRALAHLPSRLQLEVIRSLGTSSDALFLFQLCVASRDGWSQAHAQASESLASHWLALHNAWLAEEVMHRDDFNEGVQLGLFEDYEFWEPPEIEAAIRRWHTLAPSSAQAVPAACAMTSGRRPRVGAIPRLRQFSQVSRPLARSAAGPRRRLRLALCSVVWKPTLSRPCRDFRFAAADGSARR
jgi:hypothetical protein